MTVPCWQRPACWWPIRARGTQAGRAHAPPPAGTCLPTSPLPLPTPPVRAGGCVHPRAHDRPHQDEGVQHEEMHLPGETLRTRCAPAAHPLRTTCYDILCYAVICYAVLCCAMLCYAMLCGCADRAAVGSCASGIRYRGPAAAQLRSCARGCGNPYTSLHSLHVSPTLAFRESPPTQP